MVSLQWRCFQSINFSIYAAVCQILNQIPCWVSFIQLSISSLQYRTSLTKSVLVSAMLYAQSHSHSSRRTRHSSRTNNHRSSYRAPRHWNQHTTLHILNQWHSLVNCVTPTLNLPTLLSSLLSFFQISKLPQMMYSI